MTRALGKGTFHPGKESWVSGAFPTPLPVLGRVGEHGKGPDLCLCLAISTHTHTGERLDHGKPQIWLLPTALPRCDPDPTGRALAQRSPHLFVLLPLPWLRSCGGQAGTAPNHAPGKTSWVLGLEQLFAAGPCLAQHPTNPAPSSTGSLCGHSRFRAEGCEGSWDNGTGHPQGQMSPRTCRQSCLLLPPSPTATRGSQNKQPPRE